MGTVLMERAISTGVRWHSPAYQIELVNATSAFKPYIYSRITRV